MPAERLGSDPRLVALVRALRARGRLAAGDLEPEGRSAAGRSRRRDLVPDPYGDLEGRHPSYTLPHGPARPPRAVRLGAAVRAARRGVRPAGSFDEARSPWLPRRAVSPVRRAGAAGDRPSGLGDHRALGGRDLRSRPRPQRRGDHFHLSEQGDFIKGECRRRTEACCEGLPFENTGIRPTPLVNRASRRPSIGGGLTAVPGRSIPCCLRRSTCRGPSGVLSPSPTAVRRAGSTVGRGVVVDNRSVGTALGDMKAKNFPRTN